MNASQPRQLVIGVALFLGLGADLWGSGRVEPPVTRQAVVAHYCKLVYASYQESAQAGLVLAKRIEALLALPSAETMQAAREAWLQTRIPYLQTEAFRFCDGPIDAIEGRINAWPIDENYVDYTVDGPSAGIIAAVDRYPTISRGLLVALNEKEGEKNISTGFHAIEFLLWGQDLNETGPGSRSHQDYAVQGGAKHAARRGEYLRITARLLVEDLESLVAAWAPGKSDNYRARFLSLEADEALSAILKGLGSLSGPELSGERLTVPYETKEQEDEHSCFSDNTHNDFIGNVLGIQNVYLGRYVRLDGKMVSGPSLRDLLARFDASLAERLKVEIQASLDAAKAVPAPFDQAIRGKDSSPGRLAIKKLLKATLAQTESISKAAAALSLRLKL